MNPALEFAAFRMAVDSSGRISCAFGGEEGLDKDVHGRRVSVEVPFVLR